MSSSPTYAQHIIFNSSPIIQGARDAYKPTLNGKKSTCKIIAPRPPLSVCTNAPARHVRRPPPLVLVAHPTSSTTHTIIENDNAGQSQTPSPTRSWSTTSSASSSPTSFTFSPNGSRAGSGSSTTSSSANSLAGSPSLCNVNPGGQSAAISVGQLRPGGQSNSYHLEVVQHPVKTAEFGSNILSRLPLTPALIVRLIIRDNQGRVLSSPAQEIPFLIAHLSLLSADGTSPLDLGSAPPGSAMPPPPGDRQRRMLCGNLVSSAQILHDLNGEVGIFYIFSDVSLRYRGRFVLGVTLMRLQMSPTPGPGLGLAQTRTMPFDVLPYNEYNAVAPTRLMQCFQRQGARF